MSLYLVADTFFTTFEKERFRFQSPAGAASTVSVTSLSESGTTVSLRPLVAKSRYRGDSMPPCLCAAVT